ncbi:hypothetical protein Q7P35_010816 [Cladosporium inversicolor]
MPPLRKILALLVLLPIAAALAGPTSYKNSRPGQPWAACDIKSGDPRDAYTLRGSNWNVTEAELKAALNSPAGTVLTGWEWKSGVKDYDPRVQTFKAKFRLPIHEQKKTMKKLLKLVEPWQMWIIPYPQPDDKEYGPH